MKKLIIAATALAMGFAANAACVNWNVAGTSDTASYTVLLFTAKPAENYETVAALKAAAVAQATIVSKGRGAYSTGDQGTSNDSVTSTANFYFAIVDGNDAEEFNYIAATGMGNNVYNVGDTPKATFNFTAGDILGGSTGTIGKEEPTPEPTSGLLMLLGMAGLALRRKQK